MKNLFFHFTGKTGRIICHVHSSYLTGKYSGLSRHGSFNKFMMIADMEELFDLNDTQKYKSLRLIMERII